MSPKFKFKYDTVLKHRKILENKEAKKFAELHKNHGDECSKLSSMQDKYKCTQNALKAKKEEGISIDELKAYYTYMNSLNIDINTQDLKVKDAKAKKEIQRKNLVAAQKKKKVIDKLKENKLIEHREGERRSEIKVTDDINTTTTARKRIK
jgi:flagellar FliJ protein